MLLVVVLECLACTNDRIRDMPEPSKFNALLSLQSSGSPGGDAGRCVSLAAFKMSGKDLDKAARSLSIGPHQLCFWRRSDAS